MTTIAERNVVIATFAEARRMSQVELLTAARRELVRADATCAQIESEIPYNLQKERLGACIARKRGLVQRAKVEFELAVARHGAAKALLASDAEWTNLDAIFADESYVADFEGWLKFHERSLAYHEALYSDVHGEVAP